MITRQFLAVLVGAWLSFQSHASATLLGTTIDATLETVVIGVTITNQFDSPATIIDPGVEFSGVIDFFGDEGGIELDIDGTVMTVSGQLVSGLDVVGSASSLFSIRITNFGENVIGVSDIGGSFSSVNILFVPDQEIQLVFQSWSQRLFKQFAFEFRSVSEPNVSVIIGVCVAGLLLLRLRRRRTQRA
jgi:hypothetical protein